jgi:hypothetical protein
MSQRNPERFFTPQKKTRVQLFVTHFSGVCPMLKILWQPSEEVNAMRRKTFAVLALAFSLMWVLGTAAPSEGGRYYRGHSGHRYSHHHYHHRPHYSGSYYYRPYAYRPYYYRPYYRPYGYYPPYPYYYGSSVALGFPFYWPGPSFYFRF